MLHFPYHDTSFNHKPQNSNSLQTQLLKLATFSISRYFLQSETAKFKFPTNPFLKHRNLMLKSQTPSHLTTSKRIKAQRHHTSCKLSPPRFKLTKWGQEKTTPQAKKLNLSQIHMDQSKIWNGYPPARTYKVSPIKVGQITRTRNMKCVRVRRFFFFLNHFLCSFLLFFFFFDHRACGLRIHGDGDASEREKEKECELWSVFPLWELVVWDLH